jgi:cell division protein FtsZ
MPFKFDMPKEQASIIKVIGVGGGGSNAVNHMYNQGIKGVDFLVCNTDAQALDVSPVPIKIQLGESLTDGRGAGSLPEVGRNAAIENIDEIKGMLQQNTKMVFVTAGMGGGTGTGAAPVIAAAAREMGILTVGIVTVPFSFEGRKRRKQAEDGLEAMREAVDTLLVINNDKLREMFGNLSLANAFEEADNVLTTAAKGIAEVITVTGKINVDFEDVRTVMMDSGVAIMGSAKAEGEERAVKAVEHALSSPLLNDNQIVGAKYVLLNITYGSTEVLMDEISEITDYIQDEAGDTADVIWGHGHDEELGEALCVTIIATGFNSHPDTGLETERKSTKKYISLEEEVPTMITQPLESPTQRTTLDRQQPPVKENKQWHETAETAMDRQAPVQRELPKQDAPVAASNEPEPYLKPQVEEPVVNKTVQPQTNLQFEQPAPTPQPLPPVQPVQQTPQPEAREEITPAPEEDVKRYYLDDDLNVSEEPAEEHNYTVNEAPAEDEVKSSLSAEEQQERSQERVSRIRDLSMRLKTPSGLADLENEPAYKRRNVQLTNNPHSSESTISRFTLSQEEGENGEKRAEIKPNNPFLHDNVD